MHADRSVGTGAPILPEPPTGLRVHVLVTAMTAVQTTISMGLLSLPAVAPFAARSLGIAPAWVGAQISVLYGVAILSSLVAPRFVRRFGSGRSSQVALAVMTLGLCLATLPSLAAVVAGVAVMGFAYGLPNPAASHILNQHVPARNRNILFSIKQSGVPLGGTLAGLVTVPLAGWFGWRLALLTPALLALTLALLLQAFRATWDEDRDPTARLWNPPLATIRIVFGERSLRYLFVSGILLACAQLCLSTFLVVLLVEDYRMAAVAAGAILAAVQAAGFCGRLGWGLVADRLGSGASALAAIGAALAVLTGILAFAPLGALGIFLVPVLLGIGACASGWSGVFMAEADHHAPQGHASEAAALSLIGTFLGVIIGTSAFAALVPAFGSYSRTFVIVAIGSGIAAGLMLLSRRGR